jgi:hypothetical protein
MDRIEIQRALYDARNAYLKAKSAMEYHQREIAFLKQCEEELSRLDLFEQLFVS